MIIGIIGLAGSGKSTIASILEKEHGFKSIAFADGIKDTVAAMFQVDRIMLQGETVESRRDRNIADRFWSDELKREITPRNMLTMVGTDLVRKHLYDHFWVARTMKTARQLSKQSPVVISDVRHLHEIEAIIEAGGSFIHVQSQHHVKQEPTWIKSASVYNRAASWKKPFLKFWMMYISKKDNIFRSKIHDSEYALVGMLDQYRSYISEIVNVIQPNEPQESKRALSEKVNAVLPFMGDDKYAARLAMRLIDHLKDQDTITG